MEPKHDRAWLERAFLPAVTYLLGQASPRQDLVSVTKINALVILPFESAILTKPVERAKDKGVYVAVVDAA